MVLLRQVETAVKGARVPLKIKERGVQTGVRGAKALAEVAGREMKEAMSIYYRTLILINFFWTSTETSCCLAHPVDCRWNRKAALVPSTTMLVASLPSLSYSEYYSPALQAKIP